MVSSVLSRLSVSDLKERLYRSDMQPGNQFAAFVRSYVRPEFRVLDAGCGHGSGLRLRGQCAHVVGYDVDDDVFLNPEIDTPIKGDLQNLDLPSETFDLVVCSWLVEHLSDPLECFQQFARVLKPNGVLLLVTPNMFHYAMLGSRFTPFRFHRWFLRKIGIAPHDHPFPTYYRANTPWHLKRLMAKAGLNLEDKKMVEGLPRYLSFSLPTFVMGIAYERTVNAWSGFGVLRLAIVASFRKGDPGVSPTG